VFGWGKKSVKAKDKVEPTEADFQRWYERKSELMCRALGAEADVVLHAIVSYEVGGALHTYFYPHGIDGTGIATKQLARLDGGPSNNRFKAFEFVMFTRDRIDPKMGGVVLGNQNDTLSKIRGILNALAPYAEDATLDPGNTLEFPADFDDQIGGLCLVCDAYQEEKFDEEFGLMLVILVHRDEMEFAREHGTHVLLKKFRDAGIYPYSDLDRSSVLGTGVH
jgi:hypothetical protein